jgi:hypothetical protein
LPFEREHGKPKLSGDGFELVGVFLGLDEPPRKISDPIFNASGGRHAAYSNSPQRLKKCNCCGTTWPKDVEGLALGTKGNDLAGIATGAPVDPAEVRKEDYEPETGNIIALRSSGRLFRDRSQNH